MSTAPRDTTVSAADDSEHSFWLFKSPQETYLFDHWYLSPIIIYILFIILDGLYDSRLAVLAVVCPKISDSCSIVYTNPDYFHLKLTLASGIFLLSGAILALTVLLFNRWRHTIPATFQGWLSRGRIRSTSQAIDVQNAYQHFLVNYKDALQSPKRFILVGISTIVFAALGLIAVYPYVVGSYHDSDLYLGAVQWTVAFIRVIVIPFLLGYFFGVTIWAVAISGWYISHLTSKFNLTFVIEPGHPDNSGGLRSLGNFCLNMAFPILAGATFFGVYGIGDTVYGYLLEAVKAQKTLDTNVFSVVGLIVLALIPATIVFFAPLLNIHHEMIGIKERDEDEYAQYSAQLEKKIKTSLENGELEQAKGAQEELEIVRDVLHPDKIGYPTWPFDSRILRTFLIAQIPAIFSLAVSLLFPGKPTKP